MNNRRMCIWVSVVAGLALAVLLLLIGSAAASPSEPGPALPGPVTPNTGASRIAKATSGWSSGWITITPGTVETLTHNLGGDPNDYAVELWFMDTDAEGYGINTRAYGGLETGGDYYGAAWQNLTSNTIQVLRSADDTFADRVRVRVWVADPLPEYCSDWTPIAQQQTLAFTHSVGGNVDDYAVGLAFSSTLRGVNHYAYGGLVLPSGARRGAYWSSVNTSTVSVFRYLHDVTAGQVRVCVTRPDPPDYDSGWVSATLGTVMPFTHNLGMDPNMYRVRLGARSDSSAIGINSMCAGGMYDMGHPRGVNWENSTANTINVFRRSQDEHADQVRIRIWVRGYRVYLPLVLNNCSASSELAYDDGTMDATASWDTGKGFAVCFSPPGGSARVLTARYYLQDPRPIEVHVWDAITHTDLLTPFQATPAQDGWNDVDLSGYDLTVTADFCVGFLHVEDYRPTLGVDASSSGHSYEVDGAYWEPQGSDYMIRAVAVLQ